MSSSLAIQPVGVHLATYLLGARFETGRKRLFDGCRELRLRGSVLLSVPLDFESARPERGGGGGALNRYWPASLVDESSSHSKKLFCPNGLLCSLKARAVEDEIAVPTDLGIPEVLMLLAEFDPEDEIVVPGIRFINFWKEVFGGANEIEFKWIGGHNHISPPLVLMSDDKVGEEWGGDVVRWMIRLLERSACP
jgi:hypothetical protein